MTRPFTEIVVSGSGGIILTAAANAAMDA